MLTAAPQKRIFPQLIKLGRCFSSAVPEEEYTNTPHYPPILDITPEKVRERKEISEHEAIKAVKTVEEKQIKLNMPRYYGFKCYLFHEDRIQFNSLPLVQHITRTHLIENTELPSFYSSLNTDVFAEKIKNHVEEAILFQHEGLKHKSKLLEQETTINEKENIVASSVAQLVNRAILNALSENYDHLRTAEVDYDPRIEAFWFVGGMNPPENIKSSRRGLDWLKHKENEPVDRAIQYFGCPMVTLRADKPLPPIISLSEAENPDLEVPFFKYDPRVLWTESEHRHGVNVPGFWPGDPAQFSLLSYHKRGHFLSRSYNDPSEAQEALHRQGILASFGWLSALANFLGFTTFNEITYPLVTQTVVTNGRIWSFYAYQLNTLLLHKNNTTENPRRNLCWATPEFKLYEKIENGKLVGFNQDVLKVLLKFYGNTPEVRLGVNMRPYLSESEQYAADYADPEKRTWLEREYKHLMTNKPRMHIPYEIYAWEKIYKIDHKTRPMDKRLRPFELFQNPYKRALNHRLPFYIPRSQRPDLPRYKGRYAKEFWP